MAVADLPDFSGYDEEELFDEKEDFHFLTDKSPWSQEIVIKEGHEVRWLVFRWCWCSQLIIIHSINIISMITPW
jgi:hypothetical protein